MTAGLKGLGSRAIIGAFNKRLQEVTERSWVSRLALTMPSNQETESYDFLSDAPAMEEWASNRKKQGLRNFEFSVKNKKFSAGLEIDEDDWRRDKTGQIMIRVNELAARAAQLPAKILSALLVANSNAYDGAAMFHASSHVNLNGDTINNALQVTAATGTTPTNAEMETGILTGIESILGFKDDSGEPRNEDAQSFTLMVPPNMWKQAKAALKNDYSSSGVSNTLRATEFTITPVMNARLPYSSAYMYLFRDDSDVKALLWQDEVAPIMAALTEGSDYHTLNDARLYFVKRVGNGGFGRYDQAVRVEFT